MAEFAKLRVGLAQINPTVGALGDNARKILDFYEQAAAAGCDVVAFPELSVTGYPPEDLVLKQGFVAENKLVLAEILKSIGETFAIIGFVDQVEQTDEIYNAAAICQHGKVLGLYRKHLLPNYNVFDEQRYFTPGVHNPLFVKDVVVGQQMFAIHAQDFAVLTNCCGIVDLVCLFDLIDKTDNCKRLAN